MRAPGKPWRSLMFLEFSGLIDAILVTALALIVWAGYREMRRRKRAAPPEVTGSAPSAP